MVAPMPDARRPDRRTFLRLAGLLGLAVGATPASAQEADVADPRLTVETVSFQVRRQFYKGLVLRPRGGARRPGIVVCHDQRGAEAFHRGFAKRLALEGFIVVLPDLLSAFGLTPASEEAQNTLARMAPADTLAAFEAGAELLAKHAECNGAIAAVGFAGGGTVALQMAMTSARLKAVAAYYAPPPAPDRIVEIRVPVLFHWSEDDPRTAPLVDTLEKRLIGAGKIFEAYVYPDTQSGFASEPGGRRFDQKAADRAWDRTVFFLKRWLTAAG